MKIGDIIEACIVEAQEGFALLSYNEFTATLMQTELTWRVGPITVREFLGEKESVRVRVTAINENVFSASVKRTEENPWDKPPTVGSNQISEVVMVAEYGYFVQVDWYCRGLLHVKDSLKVHSHGEQVCFRIASVDPVGERVGVVEIDEIF